MRSIWKGAIGFGLVNIPIKLYSAVTEHELELDMLDKRDYSNIHYKRVNENTGKEVPWKDIVKGYKLNDRYVVLTDEDFKNASPEKTQIITIKEFVKTEQIDTLLYDKAYYLQPDESGKKAYVLLREALDKSQKAGLGSFVLRNKEHLCILKKYDKLIVLQTLLYPEQIKQTTDIEIPSSVPSSGEIKMAIDLINQLTAKKANFSKYKDNYSAELLSLIKKKSKGAKITPSKLKVVHRGGSDLAEQLKASLAAGRKRAS
jgi:DNA end-binding protein Ku